MLDRVKTMKSVTINRGRSQKKTDKKPEHIRIEEKRQQKVKRLTKEIECFSSMQNTCQAIVKPDCTKSTTVTNKSLGVKKKSLDFSSEDISNRNNYKSFFQ